MVLRWSGTRPNPPHQVHKTKFWSFCSGEPINLNILIDQPQTNPKKKKNIKATFRNSLRFDILLYLKCPCSPNGLLKFSKKRQSPLDSECQDTRPSRLLDLQSTLMDLRFSPKATTFNVSYPLRIHGTNGILTYMNAWFFLWATCREIYIYHTWIRHGIFSPTVPGDLSRRDLFESSIIGGHLNNLWVRVTNLTMPKRSPAELPESWL